MNQAGRLALAKSVLGAIPLHQLLVLAPPTRRLKLLEKIQHGFLLLGNVVISKKFCHVNWRRVARPLSLGGLGVHDLERTGLSLRVRWLWFSRTDDRRAWSGLDLQFSAEERAFFFASTYTVLGNGQTTKFWEDRWIGGRSVREIAPLLHSCIPKRRRKATTMADGLPGHLWARDIHGVVGIHEIGQYILLWRLIESTTLSDTPDQLVWKWTVSGICTAKSAYAASLHGSMTCGNWRLTWKSWAPPKVKFFLWLVSLDRCWTADRLARHGLQHHNSCPLCCQEPETMRHLLLGCSFSRHVWFEILSWMRMTCNAHDM
uniref:Reverse transcriptase zinc-binding domain-containing protein n=3 Tax=Aegilops tauschii subsp. strangulata TaxID=200361 RepID=A0A453SEC5_AEGTS